MFLLILSDLNYDKQLIIRLERSNVMLPVPEEEIAGSGSKESLECSAKVSVSIQGWSWPLKPTSATDAPMEAR